MKAIKEFENEKKSKILAEINNRQVLMSTFGYNKDILREDIGKLWKILEKRNNK